MDVDMGIALSDQEQRLLETLERINWYFGNGNLREIDLEQSRCKIEWPHMGHQWYKYTVLPDGRVRFRGHVRSIGFKIR